MGSARATELNFIDLYVGISLCRYKYTQCLLADLCMSGSTYILLGPTYCMYYIYFVMYLCKKLIRVEAAMCLHTRMYLR